MDEQISDSSISFGITLLPEIPVKDNKDLWIFGESESKRRVVVVEKQDGSYGFTLQSYGVRYKHGHRETDFITYVNVVEKDGSSYKAGLREGDVILSINGQNMARVEHKSLVSFIRQSPASLKMVVVSDERARKVELHMRYVHLQKKLQDKLKELDDLNWKEKMILTGVYRQNSATGSPLGDLGMPSIGAGTASASPTAGSGFMGGADGGAAAIQANYATERSSSGGTVCCFCPQVRLSHKSSNFQQNASPVGAASAAAAGETISTNTNSNNTKSSSAKRQDKKATQKETQTVQIVRISSKDDKKSRSSSKSMKIFDKATGNAYDCYRKCQSSRELSNGTAAGAKSRSRNNSVGDTGGVDKDKEASTTASFGNNHRSHSHHRNAVSTNMIGNGSTATNDRDSFGVGVKPKSWDNVMLGSTTKSFGGYGFGFGYGYYPSRENSTEGQSGRGLGSYHHYNHHVTHPHHHNHHSHCTHAHSHGNYYYNAKSNNGSGNKPSKDTPIPSSTYRGTQPQIPINPDHFYKYNSIVNPYHYQGTITSTSTSIGIEATSAPTGEVDTTSHHRSKTLPALRKPASARPAATDPFSTAKLEKTLSDSSLNSEHHKDFPKTMSYFKRSGDNVRFSSDEEFYGSGYSRRATTPANEKEHIFV